MKAINKSKNRLELRILLRHKYHHILGRIFNELIKEASTKQLSVTSWTQSDWGGNWTQSDWDGNWTQSDWGGNWTQSDWGGNSTQSN